MSTKMYVDVEEVCEDWGVSRAMGYKMIKDLNKRMLEENPKLIVLSGKANRKYYEESCYGMLKDESIMIHGLNNSFLYAAKKLCAKWVSKRDQVELLGTGFFLEKECNLILVTNRHVVDPRYNDKEYGEYKLSELCFENMGAIGKDVPPSKLTVGEILNLDEFIFHENYYNDIACLKNIRIKNEIKVGFTIPYDLIADENWIREKLSVCDTIAYPGFPAWYDKRNNTPIFRMGTVSSDPRLNYSFYENGGDADRIAYEGFSSGGASGSPVFAIQKGFQVGGAIQEVGSFYREVRLVGINAGHFSSEIGHSGISYMYKSSAILDILNKE